MIARLNLRVNIEMHPASHYWLDPTPMVVTVGSMVTRERPGDGQKDLKPSFSDKELCEKGRKFQSLNALFLQGTLTNLSYFLSCSCQQFLLLQFFALILLNS